MRNTARRHHYVPQFYLRGFSDPNLQNEQLHVIDKEERRHFVTTPRNIALQRDFNRINIPGYPMDAIERDLAQIEGQVATVLRSIAENATLPEEDTDRDYLIVLLLSLLQITRKFGTDSSTGTEKLQDKRCSPSLRAEKSMNLTYQISE